jgi:hypothetical protein
MLTKCLAGRRRLFVTYFEKYDDAPPEIDRFERLWLSTLVLSVFITITMFDWSMSRVGHDGAALLTATRFGGTFLLMLLCTRRRSNFFRWVIAVPFNLTIIAYDAMRLPQMLERDPVIWFVLLRLVLMFAAIYMLFTPRSRAWFAAKPSPKDE